jgi:hypothetical protein
LLDPVAAAAAAAAAVAAAAVDSSFDGVACMQQAKPRQRSTDKQTDRQIDGWAEPAGCCMAKLLGMSRLHCVSIRPKNVMTCESI